MSIAAIKAGKAFYEIFAEDKTDKGLKSAEQRLKAFGARIGLIGAAISGFAAAGLTGLGAMVKAFASSGDDIATAMASTGLSGDFLQSLKFGAAGVGVSLDGLVSSITHFNTVLAKAATGNKKAAQTLADFGLNARQLLAMSPDDRFKAVADAIAGIADPGLRAAAAVKLLGGEGRKLVALLAGGGAALASALADMQAKGLILSPEDIKLANQAQGAWMLLAASFRHVIALIGASVAPLWLKLAAVLQTVTEQVAKFLNNNRGFASTLAIALSVIFAAGAALMFLGAASIFAGLAIQGFGIVWGFLTNPITLTVLAIIAVGAAALTAAYYLDQLYNSGRGLAFLQYMAAAAATAFRLLWIAISSGRWDLAGQLIMDGLNFAFAAGITALMDMWLGFRDFVISTMVDAMAGILQMIQDAGMLIGIDMGLGNPADFAEEIKKTLNNSTSDTLGGRQQVTDDAYNKLLATMAEIANLDNNKDKIPGRDDLRDFGSLSDSFKTFTGGTAGATLSSNAGRLNWAAPANESVEDKQLDVQMEMRDLLDQLLGEVGGLEGLQAD